MVLTDILKRATDNGASDVFAIPGSPIEMKVNDAIEPMLRDKLSTDDTLELLKQIYSIDGRDMNTLTETGDDDFSFSLPGVGRFRCNAYRQRNSYAMVLRIVSFGVPKPEEFGIPEGVIDLVRFRKGLVLVTGPAGSGKSTTLACMVDRINETRANHIITIEDPIEFIHRHKRSIISQRELAQDTRTYDTALRAALRQSPNVILVGEMRDYETIQTAVTAAETGQLVLSTLHTLGAAKTIDRIIDVFPANQQQQIRMQLSMVLQAVVSQQLIPSVNGGLVPAFEIMVANSAIRNMIRENKSYQMDNVIFGGASEGMTTMDADIIKLYNAGTVTRENAIAYATNPESMAKKI